MAAGAAQVERLIIYTDLHYKLFLWGWTSHMTVKSEYFYWYDSKKKYIRECIA